MELEKFISEWTYGSTQMKDLFIDFKILLESLEGTKIDFIARPGVTYSMRGVKITQSRWPLYTMIDVIDDDPAKRWLSVCFFGDNVTDPAGFGDLVPGGLLGEDGYCFDAEDFGMKDYLIEKIMEAYSSQ